MNEKTAHLEENVVLAFQRDAPSFLEQIPVWFGVNGKDVLGSAGGDGLRLFVPGFATFGMACLRVARQVGRSAMDVDDYGDELLFRLQNENIVVCRTGGTPTPQSVRYEVLLKAWARFGESVHDAVLARHPEKETTVWWHLLTDYPPPSLAQQLATCPTLLNEEEDPPDEAGPRPRAQSD
jgi:hypothetical protein